jgi:hypothetical protein
MSDSEQATFRLLEFFDAMETWGQEAIDHFNDPDRKKMTSDQKRSHRAIQRDRLREIFREFCVDGDLAARSRDEGVSFSLDQPEYSSSKIDLLEATCVGDESSVTIRENFGMRWMVRFKLFLCDGEWKIADERLFRRKESSEWAKKPL